MSDLYDLAKSMKLTAKAVSQNAIEVVKSVSQNVGVTVIYATPIDTSRARMNWQGTVNSPATEVLSPYPAKPSDPSVGSNVAIASIRKAVSDYSGQPAGIFITNNLDYIQKLNNGSSEQAPANFVAKATIIAVKSTKNVKLLP